MTHLEEELKALKKEVTIMFMLVHAQLAKANKALHELDKDLAHEILLTEKRVNAQELSIDRDCENFLALYNPVAVDLRYILAVLKINSNLERTGDIAEGIARFLLESENAFDKKLLEETRITQMFDIAVKMMDDISEAFEQENTAMARSIFRQDVFLDEVNRAANKNIAAYILANPANSEQALHILSTIRKIERVGDQAKNIAEEIIFYIEAKVLKHSKKNA
jgi:phosphate transport system protein